MSGLTAALGQIWHLTSPYFRSEEKWFARAMVVVLIALVLLLVYVNVQFNFWNLRFFNAMQMRDGRTWIRELGVGTLIGASLVVLGALRVYLKQWLHIRWRRWMTERYLSDWLRSSNHYRMNLRSTTDNPDQRISMDVDLFITNALDIAFGAIIGNGLLGAVLTLSSFIVILWGMSISTPLPILGHDYAFPGYLVLAAFVVAVGGTALSHLFGRQLIKLTFDQQRYEADFRFGLVRVRENSEQIALLKGEERSQHALMDQFNFVVRNYRSIMARSLKLGLFTGGFLQFQFILPSLLVAPSFFAGVGLLGNLMQTSNAFGQVEGAFSFFVFQYRNLAEWKAVIDRLIGFESAAGAAEVEAKRDSRISVIESEATRQFQIEGLDLRLPNGAPLIEGGKVAIGKGERVLVTGPSGAGKSTMFRALGGIWPFGSGQITVPANAKVMIIPQKPYLPIGALGAAVAFPASVDAWTRSEIEEALKQVGLNAFVSRLEQQGHWSLMLSLGEQQRVAIARALLHKPDILFLDEATASLDEPAEAKLYSLLREGLPHSTIVSIGHRSALRSMHERRLMLVREGELSRLVEDTSPPDPAVRRDLGVV